MEGSAGANREQKIAGGDQQKQKQKQQPEEVQLPTESSPYVKYGDLEEYKMQAYGAEGHQTPVDRPHGGGGTDAPTLSGSQLSESQVNATDAMNRQGVP